MQTSPPFFLMQMSYFPLMKSCFKIFKKSDADIFQKVQKYCIYKFVIELPIKSEMWPHKLSCGWPWEPNNYFFLDLQKDRSKNQVNNFSWSNHMECCTESDYSVNIEHFLTNKILKHNNCHEHNIYIYIYKQS